MRKISFSVTLTVSFDHRLPTLALPSPIRQKKSLRSANTGKAVRRPRQTRRNETLNSQRRAAGSERRYCRETSNSVAQSFVTPVFLCA